MRTSAVMLAGWIALSGVVCAEDESITKSDLRPDAARAVIAEMEDKDYAIKEIDVSSDGKETKFKLVFAKGLPPGHYFLGADHGTLDRELREAERHGGVLPVCLKGYRVGGNVFFACLTQQIAPPGSGVRYFAKIDVPAAEFQGIVDSERSKGAKVVDQSTYEAPDGNIYHTILFHPR